MNPGTIALIVIGVIIFILLISIRQVNEYERGVKFTIGKFTSVKSAGWKIIIPVFQSMQIVDMRVRAVDIPSQEAITRDNVPVSVNAVLYYRVEDAQKAVLGVLNFHYAMAQLAQTTMRNLIGEVTLDELLANRDQISDKIRQRVEEMCKEWGIRLENVELKDVIVPDDLRRTIAKEAEAERERRAVIIKAEGELQSAEKLAQAAEILGGTKGGLHLRTLQSINDISSDQSNTTIWMVPVEAFKALEGFVEMTKAKK